MPDLLGLTLTVNDDKRTGVKEIYIFKSNEVASIAVDATSREVTNIVMLSTKKGYKVEIDDEESSYTGTLVGNYGPRMTNLLAVAVHKLDDATRLIVQTWDRTACLGVLVKMYNGKTILLGYDFDSEDAADVFKPVKKLNASGTSTSGLVGDAGATATPKILRGYQWETNYEPPFVDGTFDYTTFITAAA